MRIFELNRAVYIAAAAAIAITGATVSASAFDRKVAETKKQSPWAVFRFGFSATRKARKRRR